jgi:hypothetical protein
VKSSKVDDYPGCAPPRRRRIWPYFVVSFLALGVTVFVFCIPVVVFAMLAVAEIGESLGSFFFSVQLVVGTLVLIPALAELLWLIQTGQYFQAGMAVLYAISALRPSE